MKILILIALFFNLNELLCQENSDSFFSIQENGEVKLFLNEYGIITIKSKAYLYRIARFDKSSFSYEGIIKDYFMNGQLAYQCFFQNAKKEGSVNSYYENGILKYTGNFKSGQKDSVWTYYYDNGIVEKIIEYNCGICQLKYKNKRNGKPQIIKNDKNFSIKIIVNREGERYPIRGILKEGLMDGEWIMSGDGFKINENFEMGKFLIKDDKKPMPFITFHGFDLHENIDIFKFISYPLNKEKLANNVYIPGPGVSFVIDSKYVETSIPLGESDSLNHIVKFGNTIKLNTKFSLELKHFIIDSLKVKDDFWALIEFNITQSETVKNLCILSNSNANTESLHTFLANLKGFKPIMHNGKSKDCILYLSIFCYNGNIVFPTYNYNDFITF
jgi:hypothetical protein